MTLLVPPPSGTAVLAHCHGRAAVGLGKAWPRSHPAPLFPLHSSFPFSISLGPAEQAAFH